MENTKDRRGNRVEMPDRDSEEEDGLIDKTAYGEFVSTFHGWASFEEQIKSADRIYNITKEKRR